jgi:hypothetical protein
LELHYPGAADPDHLGLPEPLDLTAGIGRGVPVEQIPGPVAVNPAAQRAEAGMGGVVRLVVHAPRRAVAEQHVGRRQPLDEHVGLLLRVLVGPLAVADAALEAGEAPAADLQPRQVQVLDAEGSKLVLAVVVPVDAEAR